MVFLYNSPKWQQDDMVKLFSCFLRKSAGIVNERILAPISTCVFVCMAYLIVLNPFALREDILILIGGFVHHVVNHIQMGTLSRLSAQSIYKKNPTFMDMSRILHSFIRGGLCGQLGQTEFVQVQDSVIF